MARWFAFFLSAYCAVPLIARGDDSAVPRLAWNWPFATREPAGPPSIPPPAVARIIVLNGDSIAYGSGTLIDVNEKHGLVITNWHVVDGATGEISVLFPDGFRSGATVLKTDKDWDLAALAIWRPRCAPLQLSNIAPQPGDPLTIGGYGSGQFRLSTGQCVQYGAPSMRHPAEIVEVSTSARQGDSGGPILNQRGEVAGVLFGTGGGVTSGSYCGRVKQFLTSVVPTKDSAAQVAARPVTTSAPPREPPPVAPAMPRMEPVAPLNPLVATPSKPIITMPAQSSPIVAEPRAPSAWPASSNTYALPTAPPPSPQMNGPSEFNWEKFVGNSPLDQGKTALAGIGVLFVLSRIVRWLRT